MATTTPSPITLRLPSKYASSTTPSDTPFTPPSLPFLHRTWSVTHSTLPMWRTSRNVRITYKPHDPSTSSSSAPLPRLDDLVEYENANGKGGVKSVVGVDTALTADDTGSWGWRGRGWLFLITSHWEVLGWGERELPGGGVERWVVTWFEATLFTQEGVDVYSDRKEGGSEGLVKEILEKLNGIGAKELGELCEKDMRVVEVSLPWKER